MTIRASMVLFASWPLYTSQSGCSSRKMASSAGKGHSSWDSLRCCEVLQITILASRTPSMMLAGLPHDLRSSALGALGPMGDAVDGPSPSSCRAIAGSAPTGLAAAATPPAFAALMMLVIISLGLFQLVGLVQRLCFAWSLPKNEH